jgi:hypothetical protein
VHLLLLTLAAALVGLLSVGLVEPLQQRLVSGSGLTLVMTSPTELWWAQAWMGLSFLLPVLVLWEGSLVHWLRTGRLPGLSMGLLLLGMSWAAMGAGLLARGLLLAFLLPEYAAMGLSSTVSVGTLDLVSWPLRAGLVVRIGAGSWALLRRVEGG